MNTDKKTDDSCKVIATVGKYLTLSGVILFFVSFVVKIATYIIANAGSRAMLLSGDRYNFDKLINNNPWMRTVTDITDNIGFKLAFIFAGVFLIGGIVVNVYKRKGVNLLHMLLRWTLIPAVMVITMIFFIVATTGFSSQMNIALVVFVMISSCLVLADKIIYSMLLKEPVNFIRPAIIATMVVAILIAHVTLINNAGVIPSTTIADNVENISLWGLDFKRAYFHDVHFQTNASLATPGILSSYYTFAFFPAITSLLFIITGVLYLVLPNSPKSKKEEK